MLEYLREEGDVMPWEKAKEQMDAFNREGGSYSSVDEKMTEQDELEKKREFKTVVVGEDVLGREITADGKALFLPKTCQPKPMCALK